MLVCHSVSKKQKRFSFVLFSFQLVFHASVIWLGKLVKNKSQESIVKVGTREGTSPCDQSPEEFTRRDWSQGLVPRTFHKKRFEEQVAGTCPENSNCFEFVRLVTGTKVGPCDQILKQKWPVHTMGLVPAMCVSTFRKHRKHFKKNDGHLPRNPPAKLTQRVWVRVYPCRILAQRHEPFTFGKKLSRLGRWPWVGGLSCLVCKHFKEVPYITMWRCS